MPEAAEETSVGPSAEPLDSAKRGPPRWTLVEMAVLCAILAVGACLRFHRITANSFWVDEFFTVESVNGTGLAGTFELPLNQVLDRAPTPTAMRPVQPWWRLLRPDGHDNNPPLFYLVTRAWVGIFGYSELGFRSESAVWSLGAVLLLYLIVRWRSGRVAGLWAAAMMALADFHIQFAQNARSYPMVMALSLLGCLLLTAVERRGATRAGGCWLILALLAAMLTHYVAIGIVAGFALYGLVCLRARERRCVVVACVAAAALFALIWGPGIWTQSRVQRFADPSMFLEQSSGHLGMTLLRFALLPAMFLGEPPPGWDGVAAAGILVLPLSLLVAVGRERRRNAALWVIWFLGATLPVLGADVMRGTLRLNIIRYTLLASPAIYALVSSVTAALRPILRPWVPLAAVVSCALAAPIAYHDSGRPDWRRIALMIQQLARPGDVLAVAPNTPDDDVCRMWFACSTHYAQPLAGPVMVMTLPHTPDLRRRLDAYPGVVVITNEADDDGIFPTIVPTGSRWDWRVGQIYRFEPSRQVPP